VKENRAVGGNTSCAAGAKSMVLKRSSIKNRTKLATSLRRAIWLRSSCRCEACSKGLELQEVQCHHVVPVSQGGRNTPKNLVCLCAACHIATFTYPDLNLITRKWHRLRCGCKVEFYSWKVKPVPRTLRFFRRIGLSHVRRGPRDRLKILCPIHGRKYPEWTEPSVRWVAFNGRRMKVRAGGLVVRCDPHPGDLLASSARRKHQH